MINLVGLAVSLSLTKQKALKLGGVRAIIITTKRKEADQCQIENIVARLKNVKF